MKCSCWSLTKENLLAPFSQSEGSLSDQIRTLVNIWCFRRLQYSIILHVNFPYLKNITHITKHILYSDLALERKFQSIMDCLTFHHNLFSHIFQVTIDCLSVPRCHGNLLAPFRYYVLLTAMSLSKASDTCPHLDLETLQGYVVGTCTFTKKSSL